MLGSHFLNSTAAWWPTRACHDETPANVAAFVTTKNQVVAMSNKEAQRVLELSTF